MSIVNGVVNDDGTIDVTVVTGTHFLGGCRYEQGETFTLPYHQGACYLKNNSKAEEAKVSPFPPYCIDGDIGSKPLTAYRDSVFVAAGVATEVCVPSVDGCKPHYVAFTSCGGCVWANYGIESVEPAVVPTETIEGGNAPDLNPSIRTLADAEGNCITKISLISDVDTIVQLEYFGV